MAKTVMIKMAKSTPMKVFVVSIPFVVIGILCLLIGVNRWQTCDETGCFRENDSALTIAGSIILPAGLLQMCTALVISSIVSSQTHHPQRFREKESLLAPKQQQQVITTVQSLQQSRGVPPSGFAMPGPSQPMPVTQKPGISTMA